MHTPSSRRLGFKPLRVLGLEDRTVPAPFTVSSFDDLDPTGFDPATGEIGGPGGPITLRSVILAANATPGEQTVMVPAGTYRLTRVGPNEDAGWTGDLDVTDRVGLIANGAVIDASGLGDRVLDVHTVAGGTNQGVAVRGATLRNGLAVSVDGVARGGGIRSTGPLTLFDVSLTGNRAVGGSLDDAQGGGVWSAGPLTITGGSVTGNAATAAGNAQGGGVWSAGTLTLTDATISGNTAQGGSGAAAGEARGGGVYVTGSELAVTGVRVAGNSALGGASDVAGGVASGGGIDVQTGSSTRFRDVRIDHNQAVGGNATGGTSAVGGAALGGGVHADGGTFDVQYTTFDGNTARGGDGSTAAAGRGGDARGGGLLVEGYGVLTLKNDTFSGNAARGGDGTAGRGQGFGGGLVLANFGFADNRITATTVTDNEAAAGRGGDADRSDGGGVYQAKSTVFVYLSDILAGNRAAGGPDFGFDQAEGASGAFYDESNVIGVRNAGGPGSDPSRVGTADAPLDPLLTPLGYFGGSPRALVHGLLPGSPAREAVSPRVAATNDQRGLARPVGLYADAGSFEVQNTYDLTIATAGPYVQGQPFTVTGRVSDTHAQPTGTVRVLVNGVPGGTATLDATGRFTATATAPGFGPQTISYVYSGDGAFLPANSPAATVSVQEASTTTVTVSPDPAVQGEPFTINVAVASAAGVTVPYGVARVRVLGIAQFSFEQTATVANGAASFHVPSLLAGNYPVEVEFISNTPGLAGSQGATTAVVKANTIALVSVFPSPAFAGQAVTFATTVFTTDLKVAAGDATFFVDGTPVGTRPLDAAGQAALTLPTGLPAGGHAITVGFTPAATSLTFATTSPPQLITVNPAPAVVAVTASPNPAVAGQPLTLTAGVAAAFGSPVGSVTFSVNGSPVGTAALDATGGATLVLPDGLPAGTYAVTATYPGTANQTPTASPPKTLDVAVRPTVSVANATVAEGDAGTTALTFTVTLSAASPQPVRVTVATADGTAVAGRDYTGLVGQVVTFAPGETAKTVTVLVNGDTVFEPTEAFTLTLSDPVNAALAAAAAAGTITNDDFPPTVSLTVSPGTVAEGGVVTVTATLTNATAQPYTVNFSVVSASPQGTGDDITSTFTITIPAGSLTASTTVAARNDGLDEGDEVVSLSYQNAVLVEPRDFRTVSFTITDGDRPAAVDDQFTTAAAGTSVLANDNAAPGSTVQLVGNGPAHGTVNLAADGTFTYSSNPGFAGADTFQYRITNPAGEVSDPATVTITVPPAGGLPTFTIGPDQVVRRAAGPQVVTGFATNISGGQPRAFDVTTATPLLFAAQPFIDAAGTLTYTPAPGAFGTATVTVRLFAGGGATPSAAQTFTITVHQHVAESNPVSQNEVPVFAAGAGVGGPGAVTVYNADGSAAYTVTPFADGAGSRAVVADATGDGVADVIAGTGPGVAAQVVLIDGATKAPVRSFTPFEGGFSGGVFVAAGDVTGDGVADVAVTADTSGGPRVVVYDGKTGEKIADFFGIEDEAFRGGARLALGDVNADGVADLVVVAGIGGGPRVAVFDGTTLRPGTKPVKLINDFFAFEPDLRDGTYVTVGDLNADGYGDLIFGGGPGGGPRVLAFDSRSLFPPPPSDPAYEAYVAYKTRLAPGRPVEDPFVTLTSFFAGDPNLRTGVRVAAKDLDGDRRADLIAAVPTGKVMVYLGKELGATGGDPETDLSPFPDLTDGVYVG